MPKFSVVMPVYNVFGLEVAFRRCIDSVLAQSYANFELIVVDDASTDATVDLLTDYGRSDERIIVRELDSNVRQGLARNIGTAMASGDYLLYCDYDDYMYPEALSAAAAAIERYKNPDVVQFRYRTCHHQRYDNDKVSGAGRSNLWWKPHHKIYRGDEILTRFLCGRLSLMSWARAIRIDLARSVEFPQDLPEDIPHSIDLWARTRSVIVTREIHHDYIRRTYPENSPTEAKRIMHSFSHCMINLIHPKLIKHQTQLKHPMAHSIFCMKWIGSTVELLDRYDNRSEDIMLWGRMVDTVGFPARRTVFFRLWLDLLRGKFRLCLHEYRLICRYYSAYQCLQPN